MSRIVALAAGAFLFLSGSLALAQSGKRGLLWHVVQICAANKQITGSAFPCVDADVSQGTAAGYVVLHAPLDPANDIVAVPTARISGVESPVLLEPGAPNYFADAWQARRFVEASVPRVLRRENIGLAVNSLPGRTQDQLHIHVDCLQKDVEETLRLHKGIFQTERWTPLPFKLAGERYWGLRVDSDGFDGINVFKLAVDGLHVPEAEIDKLTIVAAGASFENARPGFYLLAALAGRVHQNQGHGEFLLDSACRE